MMKAFKGCTNTECSAYKKYHFKDEDRFCTKCGESLSYVCAGCWKALETNKIRYCESCDTLRSQKKARQVAKIKDGSEQLVAVAGAFAGVAVTAAKNAPKVKNAVVDLAKIVKK